MLTLLRITFIAFISIVLLNACTSFSDNNLKGTSFTDLEVSAETLSTPESQNPAETIKIAAVGDIMLGSPYPTDDRMPPNDGEDILTQASSILKAADVTFGNLEGPLADKGESAKCLNSKPKPLTDVINQSKVVPTPAAKPKPTPKSVGCYAFRMPTRYGKYLKDAGFDVLSLANNHAGDFGPEGMISSRKTLDSLELKHIGSNKTNYSSAVVETNGRKIAFIGFAHNAISPNVNNLAEARQLVIEAKKTADIVVVSFHGGAEGIAAQRVPHRTEVYGGAKRGNLPAFSRAVIDAGADLVLGHGPHVLRGMEVYKDRLIAYSLGNFATYGWFRLQNETAITMILEVELNKDGSLAKGRIHPGKLIDWGVPEIGTSKDAIKIVQRLSKADFPKTALKINDDGTF